MRSKPNYEEALKPTWRSPSPVLGLVLSVVALTLLGLVVLFSASLSPQAVGAFKKQIIFLGIALVAGVITARFDLDFFRARPVIITVAVLTFIILLAVLIPGVGIKVNGARRWLGGLGPMRLQPSELSKISLVFVLSAYLSAHQRQMHTFLKGFVIPGGIVAVFAGLIIVEPDFGTAFLCGIVGMAMMFLAGTRLLFLLPSIFGALGLFAIAIALDPVRAKRITSFLDVEAHKSDGAYQLWQGILAFAAGGIEGVGLGQGRQQLAFLPEAHTDFIFPIIGEELGLIFTLGVALLFLLIFVFGIAILRRAPTLHQFLLGAGSLLFICLQALINMGVVTGCLPTKGMSLPFISYGGSNLVVMFVFVGILLNCVQSWNRGPLVRATEM
ncbi:MAG: cell cycle protein [Verrucomicrobia bacterium 21-51-4]|nr:MAG: cell cycle protein [Verrucomicrobia bacterium 21-51-4]HQU08568.1 putative peptidoglycan glycosyltransferase FtsW [Opitutales bacterium]